MLSLIQMVKNVVTLSFTEKYTKECLNYELQFRQKDKSYLLFGIMKRREKHNIHYGFQSCTVVYRSNLK